MHRLVELGLIPDGVGVEGKNGFFKLSPDKITPQMLSYLLQNAPPGLRIEYFEFYPGCDEVDDMTGLYRTVFKTRSGFSISGGNHGRTDPAKSITLEDVLAGILDSVTRASAYLLIRI